MRRQAFLSERDTALINAHARDAYPNECTGVLTPDGYKRMTNLAADPTKHAKFDDDAMNAMVREGTLLGIVHSHAGGWNCPSEQDMRLQVTTNLPCVLAYTNGDMVLPLSVWGDMFEPDPLLRRPYQHGITDCYETCRDFYWWELGVRPPPVPRNWRWWKSTPQLIDKLTGPSGFSVVDGKDGQRGDLIICATLLGVPCHGLVYLGNDLVLNQTTVGRPLDPSRLSRIEPLANWLPYVGRWLRPDAENQAVWGAGRALRRPAPI